MSDDMLDELFGSDDESTISKPTKLDCGVLTVVNDIIDEAVPILVEAIVKEAKTLSSRDAQAVKSWSSAFDKVLSSQKDVEQLLEIVCDIQKVAMILWGRLVSGDENVSSLIKELYSTSELLVACLMTNSDIKTAIVAADKAFLFGAKNADVQVVVKSCEKQLDHERSALNLMLTPPVECLTHRLPEGFSTRDGEIVCDDRTRHITRSSELGWSSGDVDKFCEEFFKKQIPIVLDNGFLTRDWPALQKWNSVDYLMQTYGHRSVPVEVGRHHDGKWSESCEQLSDFIMRFITPSVERCNRPAESSHTNLRENIPEPESVGYVAQHKLFDQLQKLRSDFSAPNRICAACNEGRGVTLANAWFGSDGTITPLHFDSYDNFLVQVAGYKYVRLYMESEQKYLHLDEESTVARTMSQGNISPVNVEWPDAEKHPQFANATFTDVVLGPGDALFMPQGVWHYVRSVSPSFSANFWF